MTTLTDPRITHPERYDAFGRLLPEHRPKATGFHKDRPWSIACYITDCASPMHTEHADLANTVGDGPMPTRHECPYCHGDHALGTCREAKADLEPSVWERR